MLQSSIVGKGNDAIRSFFVADKLFLYLPTTFVVQIEHLVQYVCICMSLGVQTASNSESDHFDLDI